MLLVLHAVRLKGFAGTGAVAERFGLDAGQTEEDLLDAQAYGWVSRAEFAGLTGWSLTEAGRTHNEELLSVELDISGARATVGEIHDDFVPLNAEATRQFTAWQLNPGTGDLGPVAQGLAALQPRLTGALPRFAGYHDRFAAALANAATDAAWITGMEVDSCHRVWFELHEDLIATLGLTR